MITYDEALASGFGSVESEKLTFAEFKKALKDTNLALSSFTLYESSTPDQQAVIERQIRETIEKGEKG